MPNESKSWSVPYNTRKAGKSVSIGIMECMLATLLSLSIGCTGNSLNQDEQRFAEKVKDLAEGKIQGAIAGLSLGMDSISFHSTYLKSLTDFNWQIVCPSFAYEDSREFRQRLKSQAIEFSDGQEWEGDETLVRLVFINQNRPVKVIRIFRSKPADFTPAEVDYMARCFNVSEARISAEKIRAGVGLAPIFITVFTQ